ncbi:MAG: hypothetical protein K5894_15240 [Lachnospiraceae bacterium]|nr:hypothetical protein [Lachnospiraceae bacterium]
MDYTVGTYIRGYIKRTKEVLKNPGIMIPSILLMIIMSAGQLILAILTSRRSLNGALAFLSVISYANGGMYGGVPGAIGGILGKMLFIAVLNSFIVGIMTKQNPFGNFFAGIGRSFTAFAFKRPYDIAAWLFGAGSAVLIYNACNLTQGRMNGAIGVYLLILVVGSLGKRNSFLYGLILRVFFESRIKDRLSKQTVTSLMGGSAAGYLLGTILTIIGAKICTLTGLILLIFAIIFFLIGMAVKPRIAMMTVVILIGSSFAMLFTGQSEANANAAMDRYLGLYKIKGSFRNFSTFDTEGLDDFFYKNYIGTEYHFDENEKLVYDTHEEPQYGRTQTFLGFVYDEGGEYKFVHNGGVTIEDFEKRGLSYEQMLQKVIDKTYKETYYISKTEYDAEAKTIDLVVDEIMDPEDSHGVDLIYANYHLEFIDNPDGTVSIEGYKEAMCHFESGEEKDYPDGTVDITGMMVDTKGEPVVMTPIVAPDFGKKSDKGKDKAGSDSQKASEEGIEGTEDAGSEAENGDELSEDFDIEDFLEAYDGHLPDPETIVEQFGASLGGLIISMLGPGAFGGGMPIGGSPLGPWVSFDEDGDVQYTDPATGQKSIYVSNGDGTYTNPLSGVTYNLNDINNMADSRAGNADNIRRDNAGLRAWQDRQREINSNELSYTAKAWSEEKAGRNAEFNHELYQDRLYAKNGVETGDYDAYKKKWLGQQQKESELNAYYEERAAYMDAGYNTAKAYQDQADRFMNWAEKNNKSAMVWVVKTAYTGLRETASQAGEFMAGNQSASQAAAKSLVNSVAAIAKDNCGDNPVTKVTTHTVAEMVKTAAAGKIDGKTNEQIKKEMEKAGAKGFVDGLKTAIQDSVDEKLGTDKGYYTAGEYVADHVMKPAKEEFERTYGPAGD